MQPSLSNDNGAKEGFLNGFSPTETESGFYAMLMQAPVAIVVFKGPQYIIEFANELCTPIAGRNYQELIGHPAFEVVTVAEEDKKGFLQVLASVRATGQPFRLTEHPTVITREGRKENAFLNIVYQPLKEANGTVDRIMIMVTDVTESVRSKEQVQQSEAVLHLLAENMPGIITRHDRQFRYLYANSLFESYMHKGPQQVIGKNFRELNMPPQVCDFFETQLQKAFDTKTLLTVEYKDPFGEGYLLSHLTPETDENGHVQSVLVLTTDITERKRTEDELAYRKQVLETITENTDMALFLTDEKQVCIYLNGAAEKLSGFRLDELKGKQLHYFIHHSHPDGSSFPLEECPIYKAMFAQRRIKGEDLFVHKDGSFYPVTFTASPILAAGKVIGTVIEAREISEEKKQQQALRESEQRFRRLIQSNIIGTFFWHLDKGITDANDAFLSMLGYTKQDLAAGLSWVDLTPPGYEEKDRQGIEDLLAQGYHQPFEKVYLHINGTPVSVIVGSTAFEGTANREGVTFVLNISEQKKATQALQESEGRFRTMAEGTSALIAVGDESSNATYFNKAWTDLTGRNMEDLLKFGWADLVHPEDRERYVNIYLDAFARRELFTGEFRVLNKEGKYCWLLAQGPPRFRPDGSFAGYISSCVDITERKQLEQKLKEQYDELESIYRNAPIGLGIINKAFQFVRINKRLAEINGIPPAEHIGRPIEEIVPGLADQAKAVFQQVFDTGEPLLNVEIKGETKAQPGVERIWRESWHPVKNEDGETFAISIVVEEITEQKKAEEAIRQSEELMRLVLGASNTGVWVVDLVGEHIYWSPEHYTIYGVAEFDGQMESFKKLVHPDDLPAVWSAFTAAIEGAGQYQCEFRIVHPNGDIRWVSNYGHCEYDQQGKPIRFLGTVRDITTRKKTEEEIRESSQRLKAALDASLTGTFRWNIQTNDLSWDENLDKLFGLAPGQTVQSLDRFIERVHPDDRKAVMEACQRCAENGADFDREFRVVYPDGSIHWLDDKGKTHFDEGGKPLYMTGACVDITEHKTATEKIKVSEQRFQAAVQAVQGILWTNNARGEMEGEQLGWASLTGQTYEEYQGYGWSNAVHPDDAQPTIDAWNEAVRKRSTFLFEHRVRRKDGVWRRYSIRAVPLLNEAGAIIEWVGVHTDVTDQRTAEEALRQSEEQFRSLANAIPQLAWMTDAEGWIYWYNQRWFEYTGTTLEVMQGWGWKQVHHPDYIDRVTKKFMQAIAAGSDWEDTFPLRGRDGGYRWFLSRAFPIKNADGLLKGWFGTNTDITEQRLFAETLEKEVAERTEELSQSRAFLQSVLNAAQNTISTFEAIRNKEGRIVDFRLSFINNIIEGEVGTDAAQLIGNTCRKIFPHIFTSGEFEKFVACVETGEALRYETRSVHQGKETWYYVSLAKMGDGLTATSLNITTEKMAAQELALLNRQLDEQNRELQRSNEDLQQFAHVASHDLKEPVRKVTTFASRIESEFGDVLPERAKLYLSKIMSAAKRSYAMIDGVLVYSTISNADAPKSPTDLTEILQQVETDLEVLIHQKEAVLQYGALPAVSGTPVLLHQLFYNLVGNALKFSRKGIRPVITVDVATPSAAELEKVKDSSQEFTKIAITDNGIGFSDKVADRIFETFTRLHSKDMFEGTGLGLALCRKIVERHGGAIWAKGEEGKGATFFVLLPLP